MLKQPYHDLIVWREAHNLALEIYKCTENFPKHEFFGLTSQLRRGVVSIVANLVEGHGRRTRSEEIHFCVMSRGSLRECNYLLELSHDLKYLNDEDFKKLQHLSARVGYLLNKYMESKK